MTIVASSGGTAGQGRGNTAQGPRNLGGPASRAPPGAILSGPRTKVNEDQSGLLVGGRSPVRAGSLRRGTTIVVVLCPTKLVR